MENNYFFSKNVLVIFILLLYNPLYYCKKRRTPIYLIKTVLKRNLKRTLFHNSTWRKLTWINRNWTGKLQGILLSAYISRRKLYSQTFKASSEEVIVMYSEKMKAKCMKEDVWYRKKLTNGIIWEMHGFPHKFPTVWENATKSIVWRKSGKLMLILFP